MAERFMNGPARASAPAPRKDGARRSRRYRHCLAAVAILTAAPSVAAETRHDYTLFADATATHRSRAAAGGGLKRDDFDPALTFVYAAESERFRFFTELHAASGDVGEIARLQAGWRLDSGATLWLGRFHNPQGYWNTQHHHGTYVQTAIGRPGIERFDDEGGILPSHFVGLLLDGRRAAGEGVVRYELGLGQSGVLEPSGIESPKLFGAPRGRRLTASARVSYSPRDGDPTALGAFLGRNRLSAEEVPDASEVRQTVGGIFGVWARENLRLTGAVFFIENDLDNGATRRTGRFANAYLQAEYQANPAWTAYGRLEDSRGDANDPYLALFPRFVARQTVAGMRWDFARHQALKFEYARPLLAEGGFDQFAIQWSMVFP